MSTQLSERQKSDFKWFKGEMSDLYREYGRCYVAIRDKEVLGVYPTFGDGVEATSAAFEPGTFIVQEVGPDASAYTSEFASMWVVA